MFLINRVKHADVIIVLTHENLDETNHVNRSVIRTAMESYRSLTIPVTATGIPVDQVCVQDPRTWAAQFVRDIRRAYRGLRRTEEVQRFAMETLSRVQGSMLSDYLMPILIGVLRELGWSQKKIVRGSTTHRRRFPSDSEYILDMCIEHDCDKLFVGRGQQLDMSQRIFRKNDVEIVTQKWEGSKEIPARDSILDVLARLDIDEINSQLL